MREVLFVKYGACLCLGFSSINGTLEDRARQICKSEEGGKSLEAAKAICMEESVLLHDTIHLAHPHPSMGNSSVVPLSNCCRDLYETNFITYRCKRARVEEKKMEEGEDETGSEVEDMDSGKLQIDDKRTTVASSTNTVITASSSKAPTGSVSETANGARNQRVKMTAASAQLPVNHPPATVHAENHNNRTFTKEPRKSEGGGVCMGC